MSPNLDPAAPGSNADSEHRPLPSEPEGIPWAFAEAWNAGDPDGIAALFAPDADFVNVTGIWWTDREAIRRAHAYGLERIFPDSRLAVGRIRVRSPGPGVAVVHSRMTLDGQSPHPDSPHPQRRVTIFSFVGVEGEGGWRCVSAHNTDVVAGAETHLRGEDGELRAVDYRITDPEG